MSCVRRCTLCGEEYWKCPLGSSLAAMMEAVSARIAVWLAAEHEGVAKRQVGGDDPSRFCRSLAAFMSTARSFSRGSIERDQEAAVDWVRGGDLDGGRSQCGLQALHGTVQKQPRLARRARMAGAQGPLPPAHHWPAREAISSW